MTKITVFLSDDHAVFREGLRLLLEATDDIEVIGEAENGHRTVAETKRLRPDVVLMDVAMPALNGIEAARRIARDVPGTRVLILSSYSGDEYVQQAMAAGAAGYLMKETAAKDLLRAVREAGKGKAFFSLPIVARLLQKLRNGTPQSMGGAALTSRQTEVVRLIAEGYSSKEMARLLAVSIKTVEKHRQTVMNKLDIHEIATLTRYAVSTGIVESNPYAQQASHSFKLSPGYKQSIGPPAGEVPHFIWPERPVANRAMDPARLPQIRRAKSEL